MAQRQGIVTDYSDVVDRLIGSGKWQTGPALEDQLPDEWIPEAFFEYWSRAKQAP